MKRLNNVVWLTFGAIAICYLIFLIGKRFLTDHISQSNIRYAKAVIIDKKNYDINNRVTSDYSYSYSFTIGGSTYTGNSHDESLKVGDTIEVEYDRDHPDLNKPLHPKE